MASPSLFANCMLSTLAAGALAGCGGGPSVTADADVAFVGVSVIPMDGERVLADQTVLVKGDRIVAVAPSADVRVPEGATRIDGAGKFLLPGIAEMHGHVFTTPTITVEIAETFPELYVLTGVTTVRTMAGTPWQFELKAAIDSGRILGPTLYTASPSLNGQSVRDAAHGDSLVRAHHAAGYDLLKVHPGLTRASYDAIVAAAAELGIRVAGHVPADVGIQRALEAKQGVDHLDGYYIGTGSDDAKMAELARYTAAQGVYNAPTMDLWKTLLGGYTVEQLRARPELRYLLPALVEQWAQQTTQMVAAASQDPAAAQAEIAARDRMLVALHGAGAKLLLGSDSPQIFSVPGFSLVHEVKAMVGAGLSPYAVLEAATRNSAEYFGHQAEFGTVETGKRADLILAEGNPLEDIANLHRQAGVMVRGRWLPKQEIQQRLDAIAAKVGGS
ncbi:MAG: amidohydrolase family protein [Gemmatimonadales bacterium]